MNLKFVNSKTISRLVFNVCMCLDLRLLMLSSMLFITVILQVVAGYGKGYHVFRMNGIPLSHGVALDDWFAQCFDYAFAEEAVSRVH